jgi:hypothetical protein
MRFLSRVFYIWCRFSKEILCSKLIDAVGYVSAPMLRCSARCSALLAASVVLLCLIKKNAPKKLYIYKE